jgi:uncharacterized membrane protein
MITKSSARFDRLDALRGVAIVWMTVYHFCFDLNYFGWIRQDFYHDPVWTWQRSAIVSLFLLCAGAGQAVALHQGQSWEKFWRRCAQVALCALLVSVVSLGTNPKTFIYFGVLHGIAAMLIIVRLTAHWGAWLWPLGALAVASKFIAFHAVSAASGLQFLNERGFNIFGWISKLPITEDYVPIFPWLGVMWWGVAAAQWLLTNRRDVMTGNTLPIAHPLRWLVWLGTWSLTWYMLHQPVMIGAMSVLKLLVFE